MHDDVGDDEVAHAKPVQSCSASRASSLADSFRSTEALVPKAQVPTNVYPDRMERVARALCQADARDPERSIETGQWEKVVLGRLQTRRPVTLRGWKVYEKDARRFLAALDAAQERS